MKLRQLIVILFVSLSVVPLLILGASYMNYNNRKLENILENDLRVAAQLQVKAIDNFYEERQTDSSVIANYDAVRALLTATDQSVLNRLRADVNNLLMLRIGHNRFVESVTVLDANCIVLACSLPEAVGRVSALKDLDPVYRSREMRFTHVVERLPQGSGVKVIAAVQGIYDGSTLIGYVVQELNLSFFEEMRRSASLFNNGTIYMVDGKGQLIAAGDSTASREQWELSPEERADYVRAWGERDPASESGVLYYKARGERYMSYYSSFENTDWRMISSVNMDAVLRTRESARDLTLLIVLELVLLLAAVRFIMTRCITRPIEQIIEKFRRIRETCDYSIRMDHPGKNELGVVSDEINALLASVESHISREKQAQEQLKVRAERDPLTGLYNQEAIEQLLRLEVGQGGAFLFVDVDDFKEFNTRFGHMGGDRVLCFIADTLSRFADGMAGRQGGDEFVAYLREAPDRGALEQALHALLDELNRGVTLETDGAPIAVPCSIGAALAKDAATYEDWVALADKAMYDVKQHGKNGYAIASP